MHATLLKRMASWLPPSWQHEARRLHYRRQINKRRFCSNEPEYDLLESLVSPGDWAIDIGANIGHYTLHLSRLVGSQGRVLALEPVSRTFALLAANIHSAGVGNVTLLNVAASDSVRLVGMRVPVQSGVRNFYQARISAGVAEYSTLAISIDALRCPGRVRLVKVDTEGHELEVLAGMADLLSRDHPTLVVETSHEEIDTMLRGLGYWSERLPSSPNKLFRWKPPARAE